MEILSTVLVLLVLTGIVGLIVRSMIKAKRAGRSVICGGELEWMWRGSRLSFAEGTARRFCYTRDLSSKITLVSMEVSSLKHPILLEKSLKNAYF